MHLWDGSGRRNKGSRAITESSSFIPLLRKQIGPAPQSVQNIRQRKRCLEGLLDEAFCTLRDVFHVKDDAVNEAALTLKRFILQEFIKLKTKPAQQVLAIHMLVTSVHLKATIT